MSQYIFRKAFYYEIAKFEDSDSPTAVYRFTPRGCSCPAGRRGCKHTKLLTAWKAAGEPLGAVYNDDGTLLTILQVQ